jgi:hypothetical protein
MKSIKSESYIDDPRIGILKTVLEAPTKIQDRSYVLNPAFVWLGDHNGSYMVTNGTCSNLQK